MSTEQQFKLMQKFNGKNKKLSQMMYLLEISNAIIERRKNEKMH